MGKRNQQRRAEIRRQRQRQGRSRPRPNERTAGGWGPPPPIDEILDAAAEASWHRDRPSLEMVLALMAGAVTEAMGGRALAMAVSGRLQRAVRGCWDRGWQPVELAAVVARKLGPTHRRLCVDTIGGEARAYLGGSLRPDPLWLSQLDELGASTPSGETLLAAGAGSALRPSVELIGLLEHVPTLARLLQPPSEWGTARRPTTRAGSAPEETRLLARVRALLSKAESTDFPEEAEALTTKAQELMARHAIDRAALEDTGRPRVEGRRLLIDDPYAKAKAILLQTVAEANRCRSVWSEDMGFSTVFGPPDELRIADLLYTSLLTQATTAMVAAGARGRQARLPSFRSSFLAAFGDRIGERLRESVAASVDAGVARHGERLLPVLARRLEAVDDAVSNVFPGVAQFTLRTTNGFGWATGRVAADLADLAVGKRLGTPA